MSILLFESRIKKLITTCFIQGNIHIKITRMNTQKQSVYTAIYKKGKVNLQTQCSDNTKEGGARKNMAQI